MNANIWHSNSLVLGFSKLFLFCEMPTLFKHFTSTRPFITPSWLQPDSDLYSIISHFDKYLVHVIYWPTQITRPVLESNPISSLSDQHGRTQVVFNCGRVAVELIWSKHRAMFGYNDYDKCHQTPTTRVERTRPELDQVISEQQLELSLNTELNVLIQDFK